MMPSPAAARLFLLVGEPGIGKSRLAEELIAHARARDARVLVGRCWEAGGAPAYWPWVQSLRPYLRDTDADSLRSQLREGAADMAQLLPELRDLLADLAPAPPLESEGARFRLFDSMTAFLKSAAARGRWCWCSTTCTRQTSHRFCFSSSSLASSARAAC